MDFKSENLGVKGVGNTIAVAKGRGTVNVEARIKGRTTKFMLKNILYIPTNQTSLFSLGSWESGGNYFETRKNVLSLKTKNGKTVIQGNKLKPNLYQMDLEDLKPEHQVNVVHEAKASWSMWH